jgi:hypothetical protein
MEILPTGGVRLVLVVTHSISVDVALISEKDGRTHLTDVSLGPLPTAMHKERASHLELLLERMRPHLAVLVVVQPWAYIWQ